MRRNEAKRTLLRLFVPVVFCIIGLFSVQTLAEDAFVVEEEAIIGGEPVQEDAAPVIPESQRPEVSLPAIEKKPAPPKKTKEQEIVKEPAPEPDPVPISENSVSYNHAKPLFRVPKQKKEAKLPKKKEVLDERDEKKETEFGQKTIPKEPETEKVPEQRMSWCLLGLGGGFFLGGCVRVVQRVKKGKKNERLLFDNKK